MSLEQIGTTAANGPFKAKVKAAVFKAAIAIVGENPAAYTTTRAAKRHNLGQRVLQDHASVLENFYYAVATQVGEVADPSSIADLDIDNAVSALWDDVAGVTYQEANP
jgi:hypothetical protein